MYPSNRYTYTPTLILRGVPHDVQVEKDREQRRKAVTFLILCDQGLPTAECNSFAVTLLSVYL